MKLQMTPVFGGLVVGTGGIDVTYSNGTYTFSLAGRAPLVITATSVIPDSAVSVQTNQSVPITLTVPRSTDWSLSTGNAGPLSIFDISGNAAANPVTLLFSNGETVNGLAAIAINANYGGFRLQPKSGGGWIVV